jgi:hypothetical protein
MFPPGAWVSVSGSHNTAPFIRVYLTDPPSSSLPSSRSLHIWERDGKFPSIHDLPSIFPVQQRQGDDSQQEWRGQQGHLGLFYLILKKTLRGRYCDYAHLTDKETEAQDLEKSIVYGGSGIQMQTD